MRSLPDNNALQEGLLIKAYRLMLTAKCLYRLYDNRRRSCPYVHATARGHEAIQVAAGLLLTEKDYLSPYYRDDALLLGAGFSAKELIAQLLAKATDPFSGGRTYYSHPASTKAGLPKIIHQSSATGMQAIPATGIAHGFKLQELLGLKVHDQQQPIVLCSMGDGAMTEGEVSEALQAAVLYELPIIYLVQDNNWSLSATAEETRAMNAYEYTAGFKGLLRKSIDGSDFKLAYNTLKEVISYTREQRKPALIHARVPLLGHHTSGIRKEWYRPMEEFAASNAKDPTARLVRELLAYGIDQWQLSEMTEEVQEEVNRYFDECLSAPDPDVTTATTHVFKESAAPIEKEKERTPLDAPKLFMVEAGKKAIKEILEEHPESIYYGQDVGERLGGVFRETHNLGAAIDQRRIFNTAIQEAYIVGSSIGMSAVGLKPIIEIQFGDYIWPGVNQLATEMAKSSYLSNGQYPVQVLIRIPVGAYGNGGPYHSASIESTLLSIPGIKVVYPSNAADLKGLLKTAFEDPNPVVVLEHKALYWGKADATAYARSAEPSADFRVPLGKARLVVEANNEAIENGESIAVITYGMGVHWALKAEEQFKGQLSILDLRSLQPLDYDAIEQQIKIHSKAIMLTEEPAQHSYVESLAGRFTQSCFQYLDAPIQVLGAEYVPAIPLNKQLEAAVLPSTEKLSIRITELLVD